MEARPLLTTAARLLLRFQTRQSTSSLRRNPLLHNAHIAGRSLRRSPPSIPFAPVSRSLSNSSSASYQAVALAPDRGHDQHDNHEQHHQQPQVRQGTLPRSRPDAMSRLNGISGVLDSLGLQSDKPAGRSNQVNGRRPPLYSQFRSDRETVDALRTIPMADINAAHGPELRLTATLGRSIPVASGRLKIALNMLGSQVSRNKVKKDAINQRFHTRRGIVKKQLKSERWRRMFKAAFQHTVARCEKLRRQGW